MSTFPGGGVKSMECMGGLRQMVRAKMNLGMALEMQLENCPSRRLKSGLGLHLVVWMNAILFVCSQTAFGQFVVQPMLIEATARPGGRVETEILLQNWDRAEAQYVQVGTVELTQNENGSWLPVDPNEMDPNNPVDLSRIASCRPWIKLSRAGELLMVPPLKTLPVSVVIPVPAGVRGFYGAGIVVGLQPRPGVTEVALRYEFIAPVLLRIEGPSVRHKIELVDAGLEFRPQLDDSPATTLVTLSIENSGATYSRLQVLARVRAPAGDDWRVIVREPKFQEVYAIPGSHLKLKSDILRTLPSGNYMVSGALYVDGKLVKSIDKEVSFVGDKTTTRIAADAVIQMNPATVLIETVPGGMKSATVEVRNDSGEPVKIRAHLLTPKPLGGIVGGGKKGDDMSCAEWVDVSPNEFELGGYRTQNIRLVSRMPQGGAEYRGYYADLNLYASYPDGTNAGMTGAQVCVLNRQAQLSPVIEPKLVPKIDSAGEPSKYFVSARFLNLGDVHVSPKCEARLVLPDGRPIKTGPMRCEGKLSLMLPLEQRDFSGELDLSYIQAGYYRVEALLDYTPTDTRLLGTTSTRTKSAEPKVLQARTSKPVEVRIDEKNCRVLVDIPESTYKQEASKKAGGAVKW